eukprot:scaffold6819_cov51-Attheya_sp.AAC.3
MILALDSSSETLSMVRSLSTSNNSRIVMTLEAVSQKSKGAPTIEPRHQCQRPSSCLQRRRERSLLKIETWPSEDGRHPGCEMTSFAKNIAQSCVCLSTHTQANNDCWPLTFNFARKIQTHQHVLARGWPEECANRNYEESGSSRLLPALPATRQQRDRIRED